MNVIRESLLDPNGEFTEGSTLTEFQTGLNQDFLTYCFLPLAFLKFQNNWVSFKSN
jgi:hypothetical protein